MYWHSLSEFLTMGGYGPYVWASFGMTALCLLGEVMAVRRRYRLARRSTRSTKSSGKDSR